MLALSSFQVLQSVFDSQQITKHVDVARLVKGKFQDNLEMLQWMKHYWDTHSGGQPYNAKERREEAKAQYKKGHKHAGTGIKRPVAAPAGGDENEAAPSPAKPAAPKPAAAKPAAPKPAAAPATKPAAAKPRAAAPSAGKKPAGAGGADAAALTEQLGKLTLTIEGLEKERNFYFGKLREIEILSQDDEEAAAPPTEHPDVVEFKKKVLAILYATDANEEFQVPEEAAGGQAGEGDAAAGEEQQGEEGLLGG